MVGPIPSITGGDIAGAQTQSKGTSANAQGINIAPIGVNLGSILQPLQEPSWTGGYGVEVSSALLGDQSATQGLSFSTKVGGSTLPFILLAGTASIALLFYLKKRR